MEQNVSAGEQLPNVSRISVSASGFMRFVADLEQKPILLSAILVLTVLLLFGPVTHHEFLEFDDGPYVTKNIHVNTGLNLHNIVWAFTTFHEANWHPITWLTHMTDCQLFKLNPAPPHFVNLVLHAANALMLFWLLNTATAARWRSFLVAILFAVHPLNVETVAWVAQRKSLLCTFFSLLTIAAYGWYARHANWKRYLVVLAGFSLALMSKPMAVSLPLVLLLLDDWPLKRFEDLSRGGKWLRRGIEKLPLFLMSAASCCVTIYAQRSGGAVADSSALPFQMRLANMFVSYVAYIGKAVWPANLAVFYPHPQQALPWFNVILAAFILVAITIVALYSQRHRYIAVGWSFFVITLIPVIGIVQVGGQAMADRYAYVPCIGLFIIIAWGLGELSDLAAETVIPAKMPAVAALGMISAFIIATNHYLQYWQSGVKLLTHAVIVARQPDSVLEEALADALFYSGRYDEAYQHYREACTLRPAYAFCHYNMAEILFNRYQLRDALEQYRLAASLTDNREMALACLLHSSEILLDLGDYRTAEMRLAAALQIDPTNNAALQMRQRAFNAEGGGNR